MRRILAAALLIALLALRVEVRLWKFPFGDRAVLAAYFRDQSDHHWAMYARFLREVHDRTPPKARVAFIVPTMSWDDGYSYAYYRASYFMVGREVLPLVWSDDSQHPENLRAAEYFGAWRVQLPPSKSKVVWQGEGGVLLRR